MSPNKVYPAADLPLDQNKAMLGPEPRTLSVGQSGRSQELCLTYPGCGAQARLSLSGQEWAWGHETPVTLNTELVEGLDTGAALGLILKRQKGGRRVWWCQGT